MVNRTWNGALFRTWYRTQCTNRIKARFKTRNRSWWKTGPEDSNSDGVYYVKYTFDWGPTTLSTTFTDLPLGVETTVNSTYVYDTPGVYDTGYTVEFCDADSTCGGFKTISTDLLKIDDDSCEWRYTTTSPSATVEPSSVPTNALSPTVGSSSSDLYSLFPALTISVLAMILS